MSSRPSSWLRRSTSSKAAARLITASIVGHAGGGEERGAAVGARLADERVEFLLDQRVQALRRLVEDEQLGPVHEGLHEPDLLPVAVRERLDLHAELEVQAPRA